MSKKTLVNKDETVKNNIIDNEIDNEIDLNEYKLKNITFNEPLEFISKLKPCYIDIDNKVIYSISIPCENLLICKKLLIENDNEFNLIPNKSGLYWITTNEPINHCLNSGLKCINNIENDYKIIYNGSAGDIRSRIKEHLYRSDDKGGSGTQSGISIDILSNIDDNKKISHVKCLWGENKKTPKYFKNGKITKICGKEDILNDIFFSKEEKKIIKMNNSIYLKNGIDIFSEKHKNYKWIIYYLEIDNHTIRDYIEIEWRKKYGVPLLCSYTSGR
jgi:hypothetical protein